MAPDVSYRFELAKSKRAGCQNSQCKKDEIKIGKGEYRMGTLVTIRDHQSWMWKHWGCVTPAQIKRIQDMVEGLDLDVDLDVLDGWDEIDEIYQEKIRQAIKVGHVGDEDWRGDPELNRPGQKGINKRTPKKVEHSEEDREPAGTPTKKANKTSKAKKQPESDDEAPPKKKTATRKRKAEPESADDEPAPKKKARTKKAAIALEEEDDEGMGEVEPAPKKKGRAKKESLKKEDDEKMDVDELAPKRPTRIKKEPVKQETDFEEAAAEAPTLKKGRGKAKPKAKAVKHEDNEDEDDEAPLPAPKATAKKGRGKKVKAEPEPEPETDSDLNLKVQDTEIKSETLIANHLSIPQTDGPADDEGVNPQPLPQTKSKRSKNTAIKQEQQEGKTRVKREPVSGSASGVNGVNAIKAEPDSEIDEESVPKTKVKKEGSSEWFKGDKVKKEKKAKEKKGKEKGIGNGNGWVDVKREDAEAGDDVGVGAKKERKEKVKKEKGKRRKVNSEA